MKIIKKLFATVAIAAALFSAGITVTHAQITYADTMPRVVKPFHWKPYRGHAAKVKHHKRRHIRHVRHKRRTSRRRYYRAAKHRRKHARKIRKIRLNTKWVIKRDRLSYINNEDTAPINYNTATVADDLKTVNGLPTTHPKVYVEAGNYTKSIVRKALKQWEPEIQGSLTNNKNEAQIIIKYQRKGGLKETRVWVWYTYGQTWCYYGNTPAKIVLYKDAIKVSHTDSVGLQEIIAHELGHAFGLAHDFSTYSIMSQIDTYLLNKHERAKYDGMPHVAWQNRRMLRKLYHEGEYAQTNQNQSQQQMNNQNNQNNY